MSKILLIEPDKLLASNISKVLKRAGHKIEQHVDPQIALDSADAQAPDAIILDLLLAGRGGIEFLYEFRSYPDWQKLPIILFSSLSVEELTATLEGFEHLNIAAYHYKPATTLSDLTQTLSRLMQSVVA